MTERAKLPKGKKERAAPRITSPKDLERVEKALAEVKLTETQEKIAESLEVTGSLRDDLLFDIGPNVDLRCVHACLTIVNRWKPEVDKQGTVVGEAEANSDSIDACDKDAISLAALSVNVSMLKGQLDSVVTAAEADLAFTEANLRQAVRKEKREGFEGNPTEGELKDLALTHETYRDACHLLAACKELAAVVGACYFAAKRLEDRLNNRARSLTSQWGRAAR